MARIFLVVILIMLAAFLATVVTDRSRARLWPALHSAERGRRQHRSASTPCALQDHRLNTLIGAVLPWNGRRSLRHVDGLHRPDRILLDPDVHQDTGDMPAGRARHHPGAVVLGAAAFKLLSEEVFWADFLDYNRAILGAVIVDPDPSSCRAAPAWRFPTAISPAASPG